MYKHYILYCRFYAPYIYLTFNYLIFDVIGSDKEEYKEFIKGKLTLIQGMCLFYLYRRRLNIFRCMVNGFIGLYFTRNYKY